MLDDEVAFTESIKVAALSQPTAFVKCAVCVPAALNVNPFQLYGNAVGQIDKLVLDDDVAFTVITALPVISPAFAEQFASVTPVTV